MFLCDFFSFLFCGTKPFPPESGTIRDTNKVGLLDPCLLAENMKSIHSHFCPDNPTLSARTVRLALASILLKLPVGLLVVLSSFFLIKKEKQRDFSGKQTLVLTVPKIWNVFFCVESERLGGDATRLISGCF